MASRKPTGTELAKIDDILLEAQEAADGVNAVLSASISQKTLNTLSKEMKVELSKSYIKIGSRLEDSIDAAIISNIETPMWAWPRTTKRVSGGVAGSPRDIVDTQTLQDMNKVKVSFNTRGFKLNIRNGAPYSGIIHYGGYVGGNLASGGRGTYIPGRPWVTVTLGQSPNSLGTGAVSLPSSGATVVDYRSIIQEEILAAIARAAATTAAKSQRGK